MMLRGNRNLIVIAIIAVVNALGYGIIIPVLYSYSRKFGLSDFQNGLLFAVFAACQFISAPLIGRLSDRYGRRPLLLLSLLGTAASFFMLAFAPSALFLFIARALDGATAGNIPVASAVISDTTAEKDRARGFGIIGASFGFGFLFGPAISGLTVGMSEALPFIVAGAISLIAFALTWMWLPETNRHLGHVAEGKVFDLPKLFRAVLDREIGLIFLITLIYAVAFAMFIYGFQPYAVKALGLSVQRISFIFTAIGAVGLVMQLLVVSRLAKAFGTKRVYSWAFVTGTAGLLGMFFANGIVIFVAAMLVVAMANAVQFPLAQAILSEETDVRSQGSILGLNSSYMSIGQIIGPVAGGVLATLRLGYPFLVGGILALIAFCVSRVVVRRHHRKPLAV